jgi:L-threonylcarbamoyladenylate synthase
MQDGPYQLRAGGIPRDHLEQALGRPLLTLSHIDQIHSPGQLESHYAPRARLRLDATVPRTGEVYLGFGDYAHGPFSLSTSANLVEAAANLFRLLHDIDATSPAMIAVAPIPNSGLGEAINDRLTRAAAPRDR